MWLYEASFRYMYMISLTFVRVNFASACVFTVCKKQYREKLDFACARNSYRYTLTYLFWLSLLSILMHALQCMYYVYTDFQNLPIIITVWKIEIYITNFFEKGDYRIEIPETYNRAVRANFHWREENTAELKRKLKLKKY